MHTDDIVQKLCRGGMNVKDISWRVELSTNIAAQKLLDSLVKWMQDVAL